MRWVSPRDDQGDVRAADRLPLSVHVAGRLEQLTSLRSRGSASSLQIRDAQSSLKASTFGGRSRTQCPFRPRADADHGNSLSGCTTSSTRSRRSLHAPGLCRPGPRLLLAVGCHLLKLRVHQPRLAERDRRRLSGRARSLAAGARRVRCRCRAQRSRPRSRRRRAPPLPRPPGRPRQHVHDACVDLRRHGHHRRRAGARLLRLRAHPRRAPRDLFAPGSQQLRLRLAAHPSSRDGRDSVRPRRRRAGACDLAATPLDRRLPRSLPTGLRCAAHAEGGYLRTVVAWQLADWSLRLATIWFFLAAFGVEQSAQNVLLVQVTRRASSPPRFRSARAGSEPSRCSSSTSSRGRSRAQCCSPSASAAASSSRRSTPRRGPSLSC